MTQLSSAEALPLPNGLEATGSTGIEALSQQKMSMVAEALKNPSIAAVAGTLVGIGVLTWVFKHIYGKVMGKE